MHKKGACTMTKCECQINYARTDARTGAQVGNDKIVHCALHAKAKKMEELIDHIARFYAANGTVSAALAMRCVKLS